MQTKVLEFDLAQVRIAIPDNVISRVVDGSTVVLDIETGRSFSLDDVGTCVWQVLTECETARAAVARLQSEYGGPPEVIERDMVELFGKLASYNLIRLHADV